MKNTRFTKNSNSGYLPDASSQPSLQDVGSNIPQHQQQYNASAFRQNPSIITPPSPSYTQGQKPIMGKFQQSSISSQLSPLSSMIPSSSKSPRKSMAGLISPIAGSPNIPFQSGSSTVFQQRSPQMQTPISPMYGPSTGFPTQQYSTTLSPRQQPHLLMVQPSPQRMQYPRSPHGHPQLSPTPHGAFMPEQVHLKAARQLNLQLPCATSNQRSSMVRPVIYTQTSSRPVIPSLQPALPVLSSDTLDILSELPVTHPTTVKKPSPGHIERSPLLQKHLLMPAQPIPVSHKTTAGPSTRDQKPSQPQIQDSLLPQVTTFENTEKQKMNMQSNNAPEEHEKSQPINQSSIIEEDVEVLDMQTSSLETAALNSDTSLEQMDTNDKSETEIYRSKLCDHHILQLQEYEEDFTVILQELFFLQNGGNLMDFMQFCKKPSNKLLEYLKKSSLEKRTRKESQDSLAAIEKETVDSPMSDSSSKSSKKSSPASRRLKKVSSDMDTEKPQLPEVSLPSPVESTTVDNDTTAQLEVVTSIQPMQKLKRINPRLSMPATTTYDESIGSQEEILERAKREAFIQRKVVELRRQGLWSQKRLPKVMEPPRPKTHWDYLLDEMRWLSADFAQERKWKRAAARKLVRTVANYHKEQEEKSKKAEKDEQMKLRKIASTMAREIKHFWKNIEKVVDYKQQSLLGEKRQKALDIHLNFIVDQTEKYSDWLTQGLNKPTSVGSSSPRPSSRGSLKQGSDDDFLPQGSASDDEETIAFAEKDLDQDATENEISLLEQESKLPFDELLSNLPSEVLDNIGKPLEEPDELPEVKTEDEEEPPTSEVKENIESTEEVARTSDKEEDSDEEDDAKPTPISLRRSARKRKSTTDEGKEEAAKKKTKMDETVADLLPNIDPTQTPSEKPEEMGSDFEGNVSSDDDEATVEVEESQEEQDHYEEIKELQADNDLSIEELMKKYAQSPPDSIEMENEDQPCTSAQADDKEEEIDIEDEDYSEEEEEASDVSGNESEEDIGMDYLMNKDLSKDDQPAIIPPSNEEASKTSADGSPNKEITDVAAEAASLQPTGTTLATTQVVTPIPILLRHTLREYQHIGLDWLVTMYDKRLNGILADEMGLGKTIQTIALLAHLACEKSVWGPHLIVVPTSVMLNWEMEFKKWCPGFKILTYYGNQKERKLKRTGWTKSNAFHVCITSYKLVLQDHSSFRRKKWKYLVLDEAQNIKNFKSQRWQSLLNFNSQRRLLLTGTPLQNNLMELWSLMHFLMPHVFQSHKEFKEWFSNPLTGMIEGSQEYSESIVRRLHKVLRPFLLRRIKKDVEKQMPNKYEHVVMCHLSKRQRFLYEDFMSRAATKDSLASGHFMSVINILMQLRKVCNHPNLFEPRPIVSPFIANCIQYYTASIVTKAMEKSPFDEATIPHFPTMCKLSRLQRNRTSELQTPRKLIEEIDSNPPVSKKRQKPRFGVRDKLYQKILEEKQAALSKQIPPPLSLPIQNSNHLSKDGKPQSITLQYQTNEGTKWTTLANKQLRHLPGGVVQIVASNPPVKESPIKVQIEKKSEIKTKEPEVFPEIPQVKSINDVCIQNQQEYTKLLEERSADERFATLQRIARLNEDRCNSSNTWLGSDTIRLLSSITQEKSLLNLSTDFPKSGIKKSSRMKSCFITESIKSPLQRLKEMQPVTSRFVLFIPKVVARPVDFHVSHPSPDNLNKKKLLTSKVEEYLLRSTSLLHYIQSSMAVQFPEARLIQYDCGKLQVLNVLLRRFWKEKHRCLVFTQMTKVLDILEAFLSYHGYRYLRLDGSTKVEQRMALMERFNNDSRIFIFILSTRSGGVGVNLTGADTVIFYDSDWNPTMDAQAQDRCHRIGQTRDVHIYRLISERTVEENILKKANQKRLLGEMAIEGGSFTTAFFKEQALKDLFKEPTGLEELPSKSSTEPQATPLSKPITARQKAIAAAKEKETGTESEEAKKAPEDSVPEEEKDFEKALLESEDKEDAIAAKLAKEEQDADMEEFDEAKGADGQTSRLQDELQGIYEELTPIERYALRYLEECTEEINYEELKLAENQVHKAKKEWELTHLVALKEEEEQKLLEDDEIFYTREDACNEMWIDDVTGDVMPIWFPPTPPDDGNEDVYVDVISNLLYSSVPMPDVELPALHTKKDRKRMKAIDGPGPKKKTLRFDLHIPSSLFNNRSLHNKKKDKSKLHANKKQTMQLESVTGSTTAKETVPPVSNTTVAETVQPPTVSLPVLTTKEAIPSGDVGDWLITQDWTLLQAVQQVLELPLSLVVIMPAHTPNWDLVADIVNAVSAIYRSAKMCKQRFEQVVAPREDGRNAMEIPPTSTPKKKSAKPSSKLKGTKTHKTSAMVLADNNQQLSKLYSNRFLTVKTICNKRAPPSKSNTVSQFQRNPKHTTLLMDNNINYDNPLPPTEVALMRANRIAREKKIAADQSKQTTNQQPSTSSSTHVQISTSQLPKNITQGSQLTAIPLSTSNIIVNSNALTAALKRGNLQQQINNSNKTKINLQQTLIRTQNQQQIQITQGSTVSLPAGTSLHRLATSVSGITVATTDNVLSRPPTITLASQVKLTPQQIQVVTKQRLKPGKQITPQRVQLTPQQMKQLRLVQQQQQQQLVVSGSQTKGLAGARQFQARPGTTTLSAHDLSLLMNKNFGKTIQRGSKVHIAPVLAHEQAQQVQAVAAHQAQQSTNTSKSLPITVPVSGLAVNIGSNMSIANTSVSASKLSTMNIPQSYIIQQQQQLVKQRPNQQQPRQVQVNLTATGGKKAVYAMMNKRTLKATLVPQQNVSVTSHQPVAVTVTKLLQPQTNQQKLQQLQGAQIRMSQPQVATTTISSTVGNHGRLVNPQQRQATMNMQQFKQLVSQQAQLVTLAAPPSSIMTSTTKLSPTVQHQIQLSQIQLRKQPNPQILAQVQQTAISSLPQPGVNVIEPRVTINPTPIELAKPATQATVQVSVLPESSAKQNIIAMPTQPADKGNQPEQ